MLTHLVNFCRQSDIMICELTPRHLKDDLKKYISDQSTKVQIILGNVVQFTMAIFV